MFVVFFLVPIVVPGVAAQLIWMGLIYADGGLVNEVLRALGLGADAGGGDDPLFLPEDAWRERMTAPDDGKRYGWVVDTRRCR